MKNEKKILNFSIQHDKSGIIFTTCQTFYEEIDFQFHERKFLFCEIENYRVEQSYYFKA